VIERFAFIIGAMKCGTTALFKTLEQHPEICGSTEKEPNFFSHAEVRAKGFAWYEGLFRWDAKRHRVALEASTSYTKMPALPSGAAQIHAHGLEARFVYVVRDPVERIRSEYLHSLAAGWMQRPITEGLHPNTVMLSNYAFQLLPYEYCFGRERILVLGYDEFRTQREACLRRVCEFLGVDAGFAFKETGPRNSSTDYRKRLLLSMLEGTGTLDVQVDPEAVRGLPFEKLVGMCRGLAHSREQQDRLRDVVWEMRRSYTPSREQARLVRDVLSGDLARFAAAYGVDPWACG
jgi:hypothetical protein